MTAAPFIYVGAVLLAAVALGIAIYKNVRR